jgi:hypothetical protein
MFAQLRKSANMERRPRASGLRVTVEGGGLLILDFFKPQSAFVSSKKPGWADPSRACVKQIQVQAGSKDPL